MNNTFSKYIIDSSINILNNFGFNKIHFICRYANPIIVEYAINKEKEDINTLTVGNWAPIHLVARYSTLKMVIHALKNGAVMDEFVKELFYERNKEHFD